MALREILIDGDPILRKKSKKVEKIDPLLLQLIEDMVETLYESNGVGLAAPQVGVNKRVIVVDVGEGLYQMINPKIIDSEGSEIDMEGCLSVPSLIGDVERSAKVTVKALGPDGMHFKVEACGLLARCLQHEIDHLDGILFIDKAQNLREPPLYDEEVSKEDEEFAGEESSAEPEAGVNAQRAIFEVEAE